MNDSIGWTETKTRVSGLLGGLGDRPASAVGPMAFDGPKQLGLGQA